LLGFLGFKLQQSSIATISAAALIFHLPQKQGGRVDGEAFNCK